MRYVSLEFDLYYAPFSVGHNTLKCQAKSQGEILGISQAANAHYCKLMRSTHFNSSCSS